KHLLGLKNLTDLNLEGTPGGDAALKALAQHPSLRVLDVTRTDVTDVGLRALEGNEHLSTLSFGWDKDDIRVVGNQVARGRKSDITDAGLASLSKLPNLVRLYVSSDGVTDKGLE